MRKKSTRTHLTSASLGDVTNAERLAELLEEIRALFAQEQRALKRSFNRTLPFADYIVDRWKKAKDLGFGEGSCIYDSSLVLGDVVVGRNTWIGPFSVLDGSGGLVIGDNCSISAGVQIYTHDSVNWALSGGEHRSEHAPVKIGSCCYIGPNVVITRGVTIGDNCVIGANSLVNRDLPSGCKAWGTPARITVTTV